MAELNQSYEQNIEQALQLHLSPRVLAMLRILHLPYTEMAAEVEKASEENPMLEIDRPDRLAEYLKYLGTDRKVRKQVDYTEYPGMENIKDVARNLTEHLMGQLKLERLDEAEIKAGEFLITHLEPTGYLKDYEKVKAEAVSGLNVDGDTVDKMLRVVQSFEPDGVGARDLKECLLIQVREHNFENDELEEVIEQAITKHLEEIGNKNYKAVAEAMGITEDGVLEIANFIKSNLTPNPASLFQDEARHVIPSFAIEEGNIVNLEEKYGPRLKISPEYERMLKDKKTDAETVKFLKDKLMHAKELMENLERRGATLEKIIRMVVEDQRGFFDKGASSLKPLLQKDLAEKLGVHPSTVSRAISEKYIQTPKGLLPIKYLCPRELSGFSPAQIKLRLSELVAKENKLAPLTDEVLKDMLAKQGVKIERRTIASYRKELGIASFSERAAK